MGNKDWLEKDFYAVLGVKRDASEAEIKKAYRALALRTIPTQTTATREPRSASRESPRRLRSSPGRRRDPGTTACAPSSLPVHFDPPVFKSTPPPALGRINLSIGLLFGAGTLRHG